MLFAVLAVVAAMLFAAKVALRPSLPLEACRRTALKITSLRHDSVALPGKMPCFNVETMLQKRVP